MVLLHPSLVPYALTHRSRGAGWARFRELELARPPWPSIRAAISSRPDRRFTLNGVSFPYFDHPYNHTWANERCVEVPIALGRLAAVGTGRCLEVGNVLSHYAGRTPDWTIVDKYERGQGVVNVDFLDFVPGPGFDLVLSVSTLEHVGWDEVPRDHSGAKSRRALEHVRACLAPGGAALATFPVGYNPGLDRILLEGPHPFDRVDFLLRQNWENDWIQVDRTELGRPVYGNWELGDWHRADRALPPGVFPWTNVLALAQIRP